MALIIYLLIKKNRIWDFFNKFLTLRELHHATLTYVSQDNQFYTYPIHKDDISSMPDKDMIEDQLHDRNAVIESQNFEEYWINSVGSSLYDKFVNTYSKKMWQIDDNKKIDEFSFSPKGVALKEGSRHCFEGQKIIAYPVESDGYNSYFDKCVAGCDVVLNAWVKEFDLKKKRVKVNDEWLEGDIMVSTASIDTLFNCCYGSSPA